jgi:hypothetical protein
MVKHGERCQIIQCNKYMLRNTSRSQVTGVHVIPTLLGAEGHNLLVGLIGTSPPPPHPAPHAIYEFTCKRYKKWVAETKFSMLMV